MTSTFLFDSIDARIANDREDGDIAYFQALMLKLEYVTKIVVSGAVACIGDDAERHRYTLEHRLVRADSLETWEETLNTALVGPPAQVLRPSARNVTRQLTEQVGPQDWRHACITDLHAAAVKLGVTDSVGAKVALRQFFRIATQLRNRTRGHGAPTANQCGSACPRLKTSLDAIVENAEIFKLPWAHLRRNLSGKYRVSPLLNDCSAFDYLKRTRDTSMLDGVYLYLHDPSGGERHIPVPLIHFNLDSRDIFLPNGNYKKRHFESLSYTTNDVINSDGFRWSSPPAGLPRRSSIHSTNPKCLLQVNE